jgi:competence protein ComEC
VATILLGLLPAFLLILLSRYKKGLLLLGLCLIAFLTGVLCFRWNIPTVDEHNLVFYNDRGIVELRGVVATDPEIKDLAAELHLSAREIKVEGEWKDVSGLLLVRMSRFPGYHYGDVLQVKGRLETPPQLDSFDYRDYLARKGVYSLMLYPQVESLGSGKGFKPLEGIYDLRHRLSESLGSALPEPQGSLAQGILLGLQGNIPASLKTAFSQTGTAHLLAISGLHVSVVAGIVLSVGIWLFGRRRGTYIWLALGIIWLYALISGMRTPVIRAAIMGSLFLFAEYSGRQRSAITSLGIAAAVMLGIHPQILWEVSFQLSFLAMAGLIFFFPPLRGWGRRAIAAVAGEEGAAASAANFFVDGFAVTLSAIIATWPVVAYNFNIVSLVALPATFFALLALPGIIVTAALVSVLGLFAPPLAQVMGWLAWLFLSYTMGVIQVFALPSFAFLEVGAMRDTLIWGYYLALIAALWLGSHGKRSSNLFSHVVAWAQPGIASVSRFKKWAIPPLLVVTTLVWLAAMSMPDDRLHVSFLDVGEGDAILIQTPSHQNILIDGGPSPQALGLALGKKLPFWDRTIDLVVSTHPHADHVGGLVEVLQRYKVEQVLYPDINYDSPIYHEWLRLIEDREIHYTIAQAGQQIDLGGGSLIEVLHPQAELMMGTESDIDNNGVVLRLVRGEVSFLLTADTGEEAEHELLFQRANLKSTVLKVAHHGSATSTTGEFLAVVDPQVAVITAGADNPFGHPHPEIMTRLKGRLGEKGVYLTSERGTVELITDGERLWVKTEL